MDIRTLQKQKVYDELMPKLRNSYPGIQVQKDRSKDVLKFSYNGLKIDLVLLLKKDFKEMINKFKL